jgi:hypothetical protein
MIFADSAEAGRSLAWQLREYANRQDVVVLAVPRGLPLPLERPCGFLREILRHWFENRAIVIAQQNTAVQRARPKLRSLDR